jgi:uncharacterized protein YbbC (DUF1343 family)
LYIRKVPVKGVIIIGKINVGSGIDVIDKYEYLLKGKRIGLITNQTGLDKNYKSTIDILNEKFNLTALYSPEHGVRGNFQAGAQVETYVDEKTGIKVYSLYGKNKKPSVEMLEDIDVMLIDIQDVGARFYTYLYTMTYSMEACAENGKRFIVLDRINPIGGNTVEGTVLKSEFKSFVGLYPIASRYGLTMGELACLVNKEFNINSDLEVIKCEGWNRGLYFDETNLLWVSPSPNMPTIDTAVLYPGTCIFEGTNISEGRGTTKPFEIIGAPWLDPYKLAERMNKRGFTGAAFRPVYFEPTFSKYKGELCKGVQIHVKDRNKVEVFKIGLYLLNEIKEMSSESFNWIPPFKADSHYFIDLLMGTDEVRLGKCSIDEMLERFSKQIEVFRALKSKYHLYE